MPTIQRPSSEVGVGMVSWSAAVGMARANREAAPASTENSFLSSSK